MMILNLRLYCWETVAVYFVVQFVIHCHFIKNVVIFSSSRMSIIKMAIHRHTYRERERDLWCQLEFEHLITTQSIF